MQKETRRNSAAGSAKPNPPRKLTRAEKKQIAEIIRQAKGDGKAHTAQQTIPYIQMYPDGICKVTGRKYSKTVAFEDINYQLAQADDKTAIFENWCDFLNYFDASVSVQLSFINQGTQRGEAEKAVNIPAQTKGGSLCSPPEITILEDAEPRGGKLRFVDVPAMVSKNTPFMEGFVQETIKKVYNTYVEYQKKADVFYVAFSGGKDSIVTLDIVQRALPHNAFKVLFGDTGMSLRNTSAITCAVLPDSRGLSI